MTRHSAPTTCPDCGRSFRGLRGVAVHRWRAHPSSAETGTGFQAEAALWDVPVTEMRLVVAAHEAGHAVSAAQLGARVEVVVLASVDATRFGTCEVAGGGLRVGQRAIIAAAGERAADRWLRCRGLWTPRTGLACEDGGSADRALIAGLPWPGRAPAFEEVTPFAEALLDEHWESVVAVAEALEQRGRLGWDDVSDLVGPRVVWSRHRGWSADRC